MPPPHPIPPPLTLDAIRQALRDCYDPALPCNLVDLGLLHHIAITPDPNAPGANIPGVPPRHRVHIDLIPTTTPDDVTAAQISAQIQNRLSAFQTISTTTVRFLDTPTWTPARITPAGRRILGLDGNPNLIQITPKPTL